MEHFLHFGDIVVRLMDTAKKTTYHHAKNVGSTIYTRLFLANSMNLTKQIFCSCVREQSIFMQKVMSYNHAMEENVHHGLSFIFHLHFVHQQTIQSTMINNLVPCFLSNGSELKLPIQGTQRMLCAIHLNVKSLQSALIFGHHNVKTRPPGGRTNKRFWT